LPVLADELDRVPAGAELHVDFTRLDFIDHACLELLVNWVQQHEATGGRLIIDWDSLQARFGKDIEKVLAGHGHATNGTAHNGPNSAKLENAGASQH
jgi:hypothetical protein